MRFFVLVWLCVGWLWAAPSVAFYANMPNSFAGAVQQVAPAVVQVFAPTPQGHMNPLGSGVITDHNGTLVTNYHVVASGGTGGMTGTQSGYAVRQDVWVKLQDNRMRPVRFVNADQALDIAVFRLEKQGNESFPHAFLPQHTQTLQVGDVVLAIGNPHGIGQSVSMGVVSAVNRPHPEKGSIGQFIQTDAAINPGNSGGALVNPAGQIVGINTAIFSQSGGNQGIGFAIPGHVVRAVADGILQTGSVQRAWLGVVLQDMSPEVRQLMGGQSGVVIASVLPESPAAKAGLQQGDVLHTFSNQPIYSSQQFNQFLRETPNLMSQQTLMQIQRNGLTENRLVQLEPLPQRREKDRLTLSGYHPLDGAIVENRTPALNLEMGDPLTTQGVVLVDVPPAIAQNQKVQLGDAILYVNNTAVQTTQEVQNAFQRRARNWTLTLQRNGQRVKVGL